MNRRDAAALAIAGNGATSEIPLNCAEVRKLIGTVWFRSVFAQLSQDWRGRILDTLLQSSPLPDHMVRIGRHDVRVSETPYEELKRVATETILPDAVRADLQLLVGSRDAVGGGRDQAVRIRAASATRIIRQALLAGRVQSGTMTSASRTRIPSTFDFGQRRLRWTREHLTRRLEARPMARAIPGSLSRVPCHLAPHVRADG